MMYTFKMMVLAANHRLHEVLASNGQWSLSDMIMVWIDKKLIVDLVCSLDAEYKNLFQAMIAFLRQLPLHDLTFLNLIAKQNSARCDGSR